MRTTAMLKEIVAISLLRKTKRRDHFSIGWRALLTSKILNKGSSDMLY